MKAAAAIAVRDWDACSAWLTAQQWAVRWQETDTLVQSPGNVSPWVSGAGPRCSVPNFLLSNALDVVVPKIVGGLTYEDPPFLLRPRPGTTQDTVDAKTAVFSYQLQDMDWKPTLEQSVYDMAAMGTVILKWGWMEETRQFRKFKRKSNPEVITSPGTNFKTIVHTDDSEEILFEAVDHEVRRPYIEKKELGRVMGDPACKVCDIRKAKWVVEWGYVDWDGLEGLRKLPGYDIPPKEVLLDWFFRDKSSAKPDNQILSIPESMRAFLMHASPQSFPTSADPLRASLGIIERQDANSIVVVLMHGSDCILIRNDSNPYAYVAKQAGSTGHTYLSSVWRPIRDSQFGQGLGQIIGTRQMVDQGIENLALEVLAYPLHPTFTRVMGWNTQTQTIELGTGTTLQVEGDDVRKGIGLLEMPKIPTEAWQMLQYSRSQSTQSAGTDENYSMGASSPGIQTSGTRSAAGANLKGGAIASRLDGPIERFIDQVFAPFLYIMDNLNNELLPAKDLRKILATTQSAEVSAALDHVTYRNASMTFEALAGSHLGPKREMTQFLSIIEQIAINPALLEAAAEAGMKFNFATWFKSFAELSGFKFSQQFFVEMTAEEKKRRDANSAAGIAQQKNAIQQQQFQQTLAQKHGQPFDQALARAGEKATVLMTEHALQLGEEVPGTDTVG